MKSALSNQSWLVISQGRCSESLHDLCRTQQWPVVEFIDTRRGLCIAIVIGATCVAVEAGEIGAVLPLLARSLAGLDAIDRVVLIAPCTGPSVEREALANGIELCDSVEQLAASLGILMPLPLEGVRAAPAARGATGTRFAIN